MLAGFRWPPFGEEADFGALETLVRAGCQSKALGFWIRSLIEKERLWFRRQTLLKNASTATKIATAAAATAAAAPPDRQAPSRKTLRPPLSPPFGALYISPVPAAARSPEVPDVSASSFSSSRASTFTPTATSTVLMLLNTCTPRASSSVATCLLRVTKPASDFSSSTSPRGAPAMRTKSSSAPPAASKREPGEAAACTTSTITWSGRTPNIALTAARILAIVLATSSSSVGSDTTMLMRMLALPPVSVHSGKSHACTAMGASLPQAPAPPIQNTRRFRGPHAAPHSDQGETCQMHPSSAWHTSTSTGCSLGQLLESPQGQMTRRCRRPVPQSVEHEPQADTFQVHSVRSKHDCSSCGPEEEEPPHCPATAQLTFRCCRASPQPMPHADQSVVSQPQPSDIVQGLPLFGGAPLHREGAPPVHQTSRISRPSPQVALQAAQEDVRQAQASYDVQACTAGGLIASHSVSTPPEQSTERSCDPGPHMLLHSDQAETVQGHGPAPRHWRRSSGRRSEAQSSSPPLEQLTWRICRPPPQLTLQLPHSSATH